MFFISLLVFIATVLNERHFWSFQKTESVDSFIVNFQREKKRLFLIDFSTLYSSHHLDILHPVFSPQRFHFKKQESTCGEFVEELPNNFEKNKPICEKSSNDDVEKADEPVVYNEEKKQHDLNDFLEKGIKLPENFIYTTPFVDSRGFSYAYFLVTREVHPYNQSQWVKQNLSYFKVSELGEIMDRFQINDPRYHIISQISESEMAEIINGSTLIVSKNFILIRDQSKFGFSPLRFSVYSRAIMDEALKKTDYNLISYEPSVFCIEKVGNACWTFNSQKAISFLYKYSKVLLIILVLIFFALFGLYSKYLITRNHEENLQRLALQVLSHEFRTPVSSLLLESEHLSRYLSNFSEEEQDILTRMSSDIYRLQRIIEVSRNYLQATGGKVKFSKHKIHSIKDWTSDFIQNNWPLVKIEHHLACDQEVVTDIFWLKFVLSSFLENAFKHGLEPVMLKTGSYLNTISFTVQDGGNCDFTKLSEMTQAFVKSTKSQGMGLGLNIVEFIVHEWGNKIYYNSNPTSFTLVINTKTRKT